MQLSTNPSRMKWNKKGNNSTRLSALWIGDLCMHRWPNEKAEKKCAIPKYLHIQFDSIDRRNTLNYSIVCNFCFVLLLLFFHNIASRFEIVSDGLMADGGFLNRCTQPATKMQHALIVVGFVDLRCKATSSKYIWWACACAIGTASRCQNHPKREMDQENGKKKREFNNGLLFKCAYACFEHFIC